MALFTGTEVVEWVTASEIFLETKGKSKLGGRTLTDFNRTLDFNRNYLSYLKRLSLKVTQEWQSHFQEAPFAPP